MSNTKRKAMWVEYDVEIQMTGPFAASEPVDPDAIRGMLEARAPSDAALARRRAAGEKITPIPELATQVAEEVGPPAEEDAEDEEEYLPGWATFKRDDDGIYYEGRCVRGHYKDCAGRIRQWVGVTAFAAKVANHVYVVESKIPMFKNGERIKEPEGTAEQRFVQAMTPKGPRSSIKYIHYVLEPMFRFTLRVLNDRVVTEQHLNDIFEYGATHGMGQERGQNDFGRYTFKITKKAAAKA